jgi:putative membrane protein
MIVTSEALGWAFGICVVSGLLGAFSLHYAFLGWHTLAGGSAILMPLLTGLFGISVLLTSSQRKMPVQQFKGIRIEDRTVVKCSVLGTAAGVAVGWLPGLSTASANGVLASVIGYDKDRRAYILATNAANTSNAFIGLAALFGVLAAVAAYVITVWLSQYAHNLNGIDAWLLNRAVIVFIITLCLVLTWPFGALILLLATALGLVPHLVNVPRMYCMGAIMIPVMLYSFGIAGV